MNFMKMIQEHGTTEDRVFARNKPNPLTMMQTRFCRKQSLTLQHLDKGTVPDKCGIVKRADGKYEVTLKNGAALMPLDEDGKKVAVMPNIETVKRMLAAAIADATAGRLDELFVSTARKAKAS